MRAVTLHLVVALLLAVLCLAPSVHAADISYNQLVQEAQKNNYSKIEVRDGKQKTTITLSKDKQDQPKSQDGGPLFGLFPFLLTIITSPFFVVSAIAVVALIVFMDRRSKRKISKKSSPEQDLVDTGVCFADVAGCDEAVEEIEEYLDFLENTDKYKRLGASFPKGLLLHGPPGTGKTLLAKALAGEAEVPFFYAAGSDFVEKYVGVGASRIREIFTKARKEEDGAVIFIDEIDAIARKRSSDERGGSREHDQTLNALLVELDGFGSDDKVICLAATNRIDTLDSAVLRPGRFSRHIAVDLPGEKGRKEILSVHLAGRPLAEDIDIAELAVVSSGASGADLANMVNEAAILAAREDKQEIHQQHLREGYLRAIAGAEKKDSMTREEEWPVIAAHEAGHVLVAELAEEHEKAERTTIKPRGRAAGLALYGQRDRALHSPEYFAERLRVMLGGRAAEETMFSQISSGAANDLQQANALARKAVEELGFSDVSGHLRREPGDPSFSEKSKALFDKEVSRLVDSAYAEALNVLEKNKDKLEALAAKLLEKKDLDRSEILEALGLPAEERTPSAPEKPSTARRKRRARQVERAVVPEKTTRRGFAERVKSAATAFRGSAQKAD